MTPSAADALARLSRLGDQLRDHPGRELDQIEAGLESATADLRASLLNPAVPPTELRETAGDLRRLANHLAVLSSNAQSLYSGWLERLAVQAHGYSPEGRAPGGIGIAPRRSLRG